MMRGPDKTLPRVTPSRDCHEKSCDTNQEVVTGL